jgi:hypothetical protein
MALTKKHKQLILVAVLCICSIVGGFFLGRSRIKEPKPTIVTEYVNGPTMHDTINKPVPYNVILPIDTAGIIQQCVRDGIYTELFPTKIITEYIEVTKEDTSIIMRDWATTRQYAETLFDIDTIGKCDIQAEVQYNRLKRLSYDYTPVIKTVTITETKIKTFSPFVGLNMACNPWRSQEMDFIGGINGGFFIKEKYGLQFQYNHAFNTNKDFLGINLLYKF